jgi:hypothetical protein
MRGWAGGAPRAALARAGRRPAIALIAILGVLAPVTTVAVARPAGAATGNISTIAGTGAMGDNGDGIPAANARIASPHGLTVDAHGNLIFADTGNSRVRVVAVSPSNPGYPLEGCVGPCVWTIGDIYVIAGAGAPGYNGDGISVNVAQLNAPTGVAVDPAGNPVIADAGNDRVRVVAVSKANPGYPLLGWTVGDIYTIAGNGPGSHYNGDGILATIAQVFDPERVTVDAHGNPIIADTGNNRVRVMAVSASNPGYPIAGCSGPCTWTVNNIYTLAGDGVPAYYGDGLTATSSELHAPTGVAVDALGNAYVADTANHRVRVVAVSPSNPGFPISGWTQGDIYTIAGNGSHSYTIDGIPAASAQINVPGGVTIDTHGNALITDTGNARVRVIAVSPSNPGYPLAGCAGRCTWTTGDIFTVAGDGTASYNGDAVVATSAQVNLPADVAVDAQGDYFIADTNNSRVREVAIGPQVTTPCAPRTVTAAPSTDRVVVRWLAPACNGGSAITGYVVTPYLGSSALPAHTFGAHPTSGVVSGLTVKKAYRFRVAAKNVRGTGVLSGMSNGVIVGSPSAPTAAKAAKVKAGQLRVAFTPGSNNGAPIIRYTATCSSSNGGVSRSGSGSSSPLTVTGVTTHKTYACVVTATNSRGIGPRSKPSAPVAA